MATPCDLDDRISPGFYVSLDLYYTPVHIEIRNEGEGPYRPSSTFRSGVTLPRATGKVKNAFRKFVVSFA